MGDPLHRRLTPPPLPGSGARWRLARIGMALLPWLVLAEVLLRPDGGWWTGHFRAWTGLPCPFCGGTRALRALSVGDWSAALYFNPLVFAVVPGALVWTLWWAGEAWRGRPWPSEWLQRYRRAIGLAAVIALAFFWVFHIALALGMPKPELLDAGRGCGDCGDLDTASPSELNPGVLL